MIAIGLRFLTGRFHATPWGRHVNEGAPEWPPSPWRLLRSLVATWKVKLDDSLDRAEAETLLRMLAELPEFLLPSAGAGHTRHYMPWFKKGPGDKTLVFDAFVALPTESEVLVYWPDITLSPQQRAKLQQLLEHIGYFGRAEAWCEGRLLDETEAEQRKVEINCRPLGTRAPERETEIVRVLCADPATAFENDKFFQDAPKASVKTNLRQARERVAPLYDPDWHLCGETLWLHEERWSDAPGSRWVRYCRRVDCFRITPKARPRVSGKDKPQVARFALDSVVLPLLTETLPVSELARRSLMSQFGEVTARGKSEIFSGKTADGAVNTGHGHAYYLPTDEDGDGHLDHLTVVAANGFGPDELRAIDQLRKLWSRDREQSGHPLRVMLLGLGRISDNYSSGPLAKARNWISATPFLSPRHPKTRGTKRDTSELLASSLAFLTATLREELERWTSRHPNFVGINLVDIKITPAFDTGTEIFRLDKSKLRPIQFKRYRQKAGDDGGRRLSGFFRLRFKDSVQGPIALGHSSHFGLGLFVPDE